MLNKKNVCQINPGQIPDAPLAVWPRVQQLLLPFDFTSWTPTVLVVTVNWLTQCGLGENKRSNKVTSLLQKLRWPLRSGASPTKLNTSKRFRIYLEGLSEFSLKCRRARSCEATAPFHDNMLCENKQYHMVEVEHRAVLWKGETNAPGCRVFLQHCDATII